METWIGLMPSLIVQWLNYPFFFPFLLIYIYIYIGINGRSEGAEVPGITEQLHQIHMYQCLMKNNSGCFMQSSLWRKSYVLLIR